MTSTYKQFSKENKPLINQNMTKFLKENNQSAILFDSMTYSLDAGGKRFRPLLLLATIDFFSKKPIKAHYDIAASLEMIHTYSLIHDDLPAMDDDDLRRGKPTNHIVYGEALAILSGDALLTEAFHILAQAEINATIKIELISLLAKASGANGMIAGQVEDIFGEGQSIELKSLQKMHDKKTGALIRYAVEAGTILCDGNEETRKYLVTYAQNLGVAFQIKDDLLDVIGEEKVIGKKTGADEKHNKNTYVSLLGLDGAKKAFEEHCGLATESLKKAKELIALKEETPILEQIIEELKVMK